MAQVRPRHVSFARFPCTLCLHFSSPQDPDFRPRSARRALSPVRPFSRFSRQKPEDRYPCAFGRTAGKQERVEGSDMIDFWISIGSTYSYLSVMRLKSIEQASGVSFRWRPFSARATMVRAGAPTAFAQPIGSGFISDMSRVRNPAFRRSRENSAATRSASSPRPRPVGSRSAASATPKKPRRLACSARRPLSSTARFFGR